MIFTYYHCFCFTPDPCIFSFVNNLNTFASRVHFAKIHLGKVHFGGIHFDKIHFGKIHFQKIHFLMDPGARRPK